MKTPTSEQVSQALRDGSLRGSFTVEQLAALIAQQASRIAELSQNGAA